VEVIRLEKKRCQADAAVEGIKACGGGKEELGSEKGSGNCVGGNTSTRMGGVVGVYFLCLMKGQERSGDQSRVGSF